MSDVFWLTTQQLNRIKLYFPVSHGVPRVDDRRVISGIIYVIRHGLQWKDAPTAYGLHKTLYNRFVRVGVGRGSSTRSSASWRDSRGERLSDDRRHTSEGSPNGGKSVEKGSLAVLVARRVA